MRARLAALEGEVSARERALTAVKTRLQNLQTRYLKEVGALYARLTELDAQVAELEIAAGLRPPPLAISGDDVEDEAASENGSSGTADALCGNKAASADLKRMFREVAKTIHPDRALDERSRFRRHSLMAEANRAYAERDEDRLRLILHAWDRSPDSVMGSDPASEQARVERRVAALEEHLVSIEVEMADLRRSAIWRLDTKIEEARAQQWDLFAELVLQVNGEIQRATWKLRRLRERR